MTNNIDERLQQYIRHTFGNRFERSRFLRHIHNVSYLSLSITEELHNISYDIVKNVMLYKPREPRSITYSFKNINDSFLTDVTIRVTKKEEDIDTSYSTGGYHIVGGSLIDSTTGRMKPITIEVIIHIPISLTDYITTQTAQDIYSTLTHEVMHAYEDYIGEKKTGKPTYSYTSRYTSNRNEASKIINGDYDYKLQLIAYLPYFADHLEQNAFIASIVGELHGQYRPNGYENLKDIEQSIKNTASYQNFQDISDLVYGEGTYKDHGIYAILKAREELGTFNETEPILKQLFNTGWKGSQWYQWIQEFWYKLSQRFTDVLMKAAERYMLENPSTQKVIH